MSIILYQNGAISLNHATKETYDPWTTHIWDCVLQIRRWNPEIPIYMITGEHDVSEEHNFNEYNITRFFLKDLNPRYDLNSVDYAHKSQESKSWLMRNFYIEALMKKLQLKDVFTFDNDVLVFTELDKIAKVCSEIYNGISLTRESEMNVIFGMCYIKDENYISLANDFFWKVIKTEQGRGLMDMELWNIISRTNPNFVQNFPLWVDSEYQNLLGGIFDPISIGQFLGGTHAGLGPGHTQRHHLIHQRLLEGNWIFRKESDEKNRYQYFIVDKRDGTKTKILSIHVHSKNLKMFM